MAFSAIPCARLLSINSGVRSGFSRKYGIDEPIDGYYESTCNNRRTRNVLCAKPVERLSEIDRKHRVIIRAQAVSDAPLATEPRNIAQVNEAIRKCDSVQTALKILEETKAEGVLTPNEGTYASLMLLCRKHRQGERALIVYEAMKQAKESISTRTYNTLLSCCQQALRAEDAFRIKGEMEAAGVKADVVTYTTLIDVVVKANPYRGRNSPAERLQKALELYKEMQNLSIAPDIKTFNALLMAAADAKSAEKALELYQNLLKAGLAANEFTFELLLKTFGSGGRIKAALQAYNESRAAGVALNTSTYNFLIEACATAPQPNVKQAWAFYEEMQAAKNVKPNAQTFINLISASSKAADNAGVMKAFQLMKGLGFTRSITTTAYNQIIESASVANTLADALKIYREMKKAGYKPNAVTYGSLMSACIRNKDFKQAENLKNEFKNLDVSSNQSVLHSLMRAYGDAGKWQDSINIFQDMVKKGIPPNEASFANVFDACFGKDEISALTTLENNELQLTPGLNAAIELYQECASKGQLKNYSSQILARCDVRTLSLAGTVVALLAWLKEVRKTPPASDLIIVTGNEKEKEDTAAGKQRLRLPKRHNIAQRTLRAVGLQVMRLNTLAMLTLTVSQDSLKSWVAGPDPFLNKANEADEPDEANATSSETKDGLNEVVSESATERNEEQISPDEANAASSETKDGLNEVVSESVTEGNEELTSPDEANAASSETKDGLNEVVSESATEEKKEQTSVDLKEDGALAAET